MHSIVFLIALASYLANSIRSEELVFPIWNSPNQLSLSNSKSNQTIVLHLNSNDRVKVDFENHCEYFAGYILYLQDESNAAISFCDNKIFNGYFKLDNVGSYILQYKNGSHFLNKVHSNKVKRSFPIEGFLLDKIWKILPKKKKHRKKFRKSRNKVCSKKNCDYSLLNRNEIPKWVKLVVIVDSSVSDFHGEENVQRFVLTLFNIVSAIYADPTLGANLRFVIMKIIFMSKDNQNKIIVKGKSKLSLSNVNSWNRNFWNSLDENDRHDIGVWLTRRNIGGPSGYAPVGGVCDPSRSCSLIKEEGLSSSFIIAHELGHALGMSHDGDKGSGNTCDQEALEGSVMAPLVGATFSYFRWSYCSAKEYHIKSKSKDWSCLLNYPHSKEAKFIENTIEPTYSLDDQCRMEFGEGFLFCRSFKLNDPCRHLWCCHEDTPDLCKTKKGSPVDGTECGKSKWCVNGYCRSMTKKRASKDGLRHNPRPGGWSNWSHWGNCSRSCGTGAAFRTRVCNNPSPAYGGRYCIGNNEEFKLCNIIPCEIESDFRADQCQLMDKNSVPYESRKHKCKLHCMNKSFNKSTSSYDFVIDGTLCSYNHPSNICIQGKCVRIGCDKILGSSVTEDKCGICGGDGSQCRQLQKTLTPSKTNYIFPKGARNIKIFSDQVTEILINDLDSRNIIFNGSLDKLSESFISHGTKFYFNQKSLKATGPLIRPIVLNVRLENSSQISVEHWQTKNSESLFSLRKKTLSKCIDSKSTIKRRIRKRRFCRDTELRKKHFNRKRQNNLCHNDDDSCKFHWVTQQWQNCSHSCGLFGNRYREIFCVPKFINQTSRVEQKRKHMVKPDKCLGPRPKKIQKCNRIACPGRWQPGNWSKCTETMEGGGGEIEQTGYRKCVGLQRRQQKCHPISESETFYKCVNEPQVLKKCLIHKCLNKKSIKLCKTDDILTICSDPLLYHHYCILQNFRNYYCCKSCDEYLNKKF